MDNQILTEIRAKNLDYPIVEPLVKVADESVTGSATETIDFQIDPNEKWFIKEILLQSTGEFSVRPYDTGRGRKNWFEDGAILKSALARDNAYRLVFPVPLEVRSGTVYLELTDTSGSTNAVQLVFVGIKLKKNA